MSDECIVPLFFCALHTRHRRMFSQYTSLLLHSTLFISQPMSLHYLIYILYNWGSVVAYNKRIGWVNGKASKNDSHKQMSSQVVCCSKYVVAAIGKIAREKKIHDHHCRTVALVLIPHKASLSFTLLLCIIMLSIIVAIMFVCTENGYVLDDISGVKQRPI